MVPIVLTSINTISAGRSERRFRDPPPDGFASAGMGLMKPELVTLYGPGEEVQEGTH